MGVSVLVVDDDSAVREALVMLLRDEGYTVYEAPDGKPALDWLRALAEGMVVLLDINMPGLDGIRLMQEVEAETPLASQHAYIIMTARKHTLPLAFAQQLARLHIPVFVKPFDVDALLAAVAAAAARVR